ncbi:lipoate--protein ligase family protein [Spirochaetia bacterium 38H-sp]|uniref:Lipoate--protein ligase family protein n=1 Tax=Rarispira pelagica TaxID=3141764 RepID=A0ABU9U902_9SPIR
MKRKVIFSRSDNVYLNLAYEEYLLGNTEDEVLFVYANSPSVVIGRFQNPWAECNPLFLKKNDINLARRISGGGAVYHDSGNINFCLISDRKCNRDFLALILSDVLIGIGLETKIDERSAIFLSDGKKVSGAAFKIAQGRIMLHSTLLVSSDSSVVSSALRPVCGFFESRAISSVRANVGCVCDYVDVLPEDIVGMVADKWSLSQEYVWEDDIKKCCADRAEFFASWEWLFSSTPSFVWRYRNLSVFVEKGLISSVEPLRGSSHFIGSRFNPYEFCVAQECERL